MSGTPAGGGRAPVLYVPHGGGPMPLLGDPGHGALIDFLRRVPDRLPRPAAILVISAHWEAPVPAVTAGNRPGLLYDYGGFPPESYAITYPAPGAPALAAEVRALLDDAGIPLTGDDRRGFDHGMFVPLKLMYPDADIPCLQLSLLANLDAMSHIALGRALAPLLDKDVLVLGSGMSFHNIRAFFVPGLVSDENNAGFEAWLGETCTARMDEDTRAGQLANWHRAPGGLACHPRPEHLLPLHVCYGMAQGPAERVFSDTVMGKRVSGFLWQ